RGGRAAPRSPPVEGGSNRPGGSGVIGGIPPGARITVEVDEYDNTATLLLGRGWYNGISLSPGEVKTVPVPTYATGTIVTICGAPAVGGSGSPGDTGGGRLDHEGLLREPSAG